MHRKKDAVTLAYDANVKRLRTEGAIVLAHLMNEAIGEMTEQFNEALTRGEVLTISGSQEEMKEFLRRAAEKELGPAKGGPRALVGKK